MTNTNYPNVVSLEYAASVFEGMRLKLKSFASRRYGINDDCASDLTQETFLRVTKAVKERGVELRKSTLENYFFRIFDHLCIDRKRRPEVGISLDSLNFEIGNNTRHKGISEIYLEVVADGCLDELKPELNETVRLHLQGIDYEGISKILGIPRGTVKSRMFEVKKRIRKALRSLR